MLSKKNAVLPCRHTMWFDAKVASRKTGLTVLPCLNASVCGSMPSGPGDKHK